LVQCVAGVVAGVGVVLMGGALRVPPIAPLVGISRSVVTAAAHKLARLIYAMLTRGQPYTDQRQAYYEERYRERVVASLTRRAQQLGLQRVPLAGASPQTTTA
jgi:hypothetical protein